MGKISKVKLSLGVILLVCYSEGSAQIGQDEITTRRIWSNEYHNAFTSLIQFNDYFYCSFRQGSHHVGGINGVVRIIRSEDGIKWKTVAILERKGYDLRDPKLSITPNGRIMVLMGGSVYKDTNKEDIKLISRLSHVSFSDVSVNKFTHPKPINLPIDIKTNNDWLWRVYLVKWK